MSESTMNILLLMTDQQRFDTIAAAGYGHMITPNLDRLVREGCLFRCAYTPNPVCVPARHHLLTGCTGRRHGFYVNGSTPMDASIPTLPRLLSDAGYQTRAIGKMHFVPPRRHHGFDRLELMEEVPRFREADEYAMYLQSVGLGHVQNLHGVRNLLYECPQRSLVPDEHHGSTWVADRTIAFLESNAGRRPFFCWSSWIAPHPPYNVPRSVADWYRDRPLPEPVQSVTQRNPFTQIMSEATTFPPRGREAAFRRRRQEVYYAQISYVDQQIGRIYQTLERLGLLETTLIIFTSDHGEMLGDHGTQQKSQAYEGSQHIPLIMRYPPKLATGSVRDDFVDLNDILPTVLDLAGLEHPQADQLPGGSVFGSGKDRSVQHTSLGEGGRRWASLRNRRFKYTYYYGFGFEELFDLQRDPGETTNLLAGQALDGEAEAARARLRSRLVEYERRWGPVDACVDEGGAFIEHPPPEDDRSMQAIREGQFPSFGKQLDPAERAALTPFAEEAWQATRDEPLSQLERFDLRAWRGQGATQAFLQRIGHPQAADRSGAQRDG